MSDSTTQSDARACPVDGCENTELDDLDEDDELDYFCHWCGNLFVDDGGELDAR